MMDKLNGCFFSIEYDLLLEKYNTIWDKVSAGIKQELYSGPVYNKEFLRTEIKSHDDEITGFYDKNFIRWILIILA